MSSATESEQVYALKCMTCRLASQPLWALREHAQQARAKFQARMERDRELDRAFAIARPQLRWGMSDQDVRQEVARVNAVLLSLGVATD